MVLTGALIFIILNWKIVDEKMPKLDGSVCLLLFGRSFNYVESEWLFRLIFDCSYSVIASISNKACFALVVDCYATGTIKFTLLRCSVSIPFLAWSCKYFNLTCAVFGQNDISKLKFLRNIRFTHPCEKIL